MIEKLKDRDQNDRQIEIGIEIEIIEKGNKIKQNRQNIQYLKVMWKIKRVNIESRKNKLNRINKMKLRKNKVKVRKSPLRRNNQIDTN